MTKQLRRAVPQQTPQSQIAEPEVLAELFHALSDPGRLRILALLQQGEVCVCDIVSVIGLANSTISKHLEVLRHAGIIAARKEGRWIHYSLCKPSPLPPATLRWILQGLSASAVGQADQLLREHQCCTSSSCVTKL